MRLLFLSLLSVITFHLTAQELRCSVQVNHSRIQGTNTQIFQNLQRDLNEFMNNRKWTNNVFANNERIECRIMINISEFNNIDKFKGTITFQASRPVFNTNYKSVLVNYKEKDNLFEFEYTDGQRLEFNENSHLSNLTSVMAFYAYIFIGLDYDSFGLMSGTPYFQKAMQIANNAQAGTEAGWKPYQSTDRTNRYYLAQSFLESENEPLRRFYYYYHRNGLDKMAEDVNRGRAGISKHFKALRVSYNKNPNSLLLKIILTTKIDEFVNIYSEAPVTEKKEVYNILKDVMPTNNKVDKIMD